VHSNRIHAEKHLIAEDAGVPQQEGEEYEIGFKPPGLNGRLEICHQERRAENAA